MAIGNGSGCMRLTHSSQLRGRRRRCHHNFISEPFLLFSGTETFFRKSQILNVFLWKSVTNLGQLMSLNANTIPKIFECIQIFRYFEEKNYIVCSVDLSKHNMGGVRITFFLQPPTQSGRIKEIFLTPSLAYIPVFS